MIHQSKTERSDRQDVLNYIEAADAIPHRSEGESVLIDHITTNAKRILDIGTGDRRLNKLVKFGLPQNIEVVAVDVSPMIIKAVKDSFSNDSRFTIIEHDLDNPLPDLRYFNVIISSFAIHNLTHQRKYALYEEIYSLNCYFLVYTSSLFA